MRYFLLRLSLYDNNNNLYDNNRNNHEYKTKKKRNEISNNYLVSTFSLLSCT